LNSYKAEYSRYQTLFEDCLSSVLANLKQNAPKTLIDAMNYAIIDGGKRVRPVLCFSTCEMLGVDPLKAKELAIALECIHSYSLVHDDLPAMDNDDFRRGKLSTHKKFGEANGVLAGDALLNFAFEVVLSKKDFSQKDAKALAILADCAGYSGMIAGQVLDLENENSKIVDSDILYKIYENKTAKLITAPLLMASVLADYKHFEDLKELGYHLGITFQMVDDLMDVEGTLESIGKTPNKDLKDDKLTSIKVFGVNGVKERIKYHHGKCKELLATINASEFLTQLVDAMAVRKK